MSNDPPGLPSQARRSRREMLADLKTLAQVGALVSTAGLPVVVAVMVLAAAGRDLNTAIAILRVADPVRLGLVALVALSLLSALLPMFLSMFDGPPFSLSMKAPRQGALVLAVVSAGLAAVWFGVRSISEPNVAWFAVFAVIAGYAIKSVVAHGSWRSGNDWGLIVAVSAFVAAASFINPFPQAAITFPGDDDATVVRIVDESSDGTWYLVTKLQTEGSLLEWHPGKPESIVLCTKDPQSSCEVKSSPSGGSPSSTPEPSGD